jgi:ABC-type multidrug transport system fused ATPase/permease subunit
MFKYLSKFLYVLPASKHRLLFLIFLFISVSSLETFGIGLIGPFLALASNPAFIRRNIFSSWLFENLNLSSENQFVAILGCFIIFIFIVKSVVSWRVKTYVFRFSFGQRGKLCQRLLHAYLTAPYTFHLSKSSAYIIQSITGDTGTFANSVLMSLLDTTANLIVVLSLTILLGWTNLIAVVIILGICLPLFLVFHKLRDKLRFWGKTVTRSNEAIFRVVNHSIGGIKETQIIGCSSYFEKQLIEHVQQYEDAGASLFEIKLLPRILIETLLIVFVIGFTTSFLLLGKNVQELTADLGVFALASIRLMPAITNLINGMNTLRSSSYSLNKIYNDLIELEKVEQDSGLKSLNSRSLNFQPNKVIHLTSRILLEDITYCYSSSKGKALDNVNLIIDKGQSIALVGKSGAGKTTLVDVILGLLIPQDGDIKVDGNSIYNDLRSWQNLIGYIPQSIFLIDDSIERNIAFGVPDCDIDPSRLQKAIEMAQLSELIDELPEGIKTWVGDRGVRLSGGQRQRIGIARVLYHERAILVLDEATSALDNETEHLVTEAIKSLSGIKTMIIIAHRLSTIEHCDRVYRMDKGCISSVQE